MSQLQSASDVLAVVGVERQATVHYGKLLDGEVWILHSQECLDAAANGGDLRDCDFSKALDVGIDPRQWHEGVACPLRVDTRYSPSIVRPA